MAWMIDRDYLNDRDDPYNRVGTQSTGEQLTGEVFRFRIRDDDGEVYYGGRADATAAEHDEENGGLYQALLWATRDAGAVDLQVHVVDGLAHGLTSNRYVEQLGLAPDAWISIYG